MTWEFSKCFCTCLGWPRSKQLCFYFLPLSDQGPEMKQSGMQVPSWRFLSSKQSWNTNQRKVWLPHLSTPGTHQQGCLLSGSKLTKYSSVSYKEHSPITQQRSAMSRGTSAKTYSFCRSPTWFMFCSHREGPWYSPIFLI